MNQPIQREPTSHFVRGARCAGFTLLELILVLVILSTLIVQLSFRTLPSASVAQARGFHDETLALLRFAQKTAIAQRRIVCVALGSTGVSLAIDTAAAADGNCETALSAVATVGGGTGLTAAPSSFEFHPGGGTNLADTLTVSIDGSSSLFVEAATGYVHD